MKVLGIFFLFVFTATLTVLLQTPRSFSDPSDASLIAQHIVDTYLPGASPLDPSSPHVYVQAASLADNDTIAYGDLQAESYYSAVAGEYLAWVDDVPGASFEHPSRIMIATVLGTDVTIEHIFPTAVSVILNDSLIWADVDAALGPDLYFPDTTYWDVVDPDGDVEEPGAEFEDAEDASACAIYGNWEQSSSRDSKGQVDKMLDNMGIPDENQDVKTFSNTDDLNDETLRTQIEDAVRTAGQKGSGDEFVLVMAFHGNCGGIAINKSKKNHKPKAWIDYDDLLCSICKALKNTPKRRVLLIINSCGAGGIIDALNALDCPDCDGFEFIISASCRSDEYSYTSNYVLFVGRPWDWLEELQDYDWSGDADMKDTAEAAHDDQKGDIDNDDQHPVWGERQISGISVEKQTCFVPAICNLAQNDPNPFNAVTRIGYTLPERCHVKVEIYRVLGTRITVLVNEEQDGGRRVVHWDGRNEDGIKVPGGIYFYCLTAGDYFAVRKMAIIR